MPLGRGIIDLLLRNRFITKELRNQQEWKNAFFGRNNSFSDCNNIKSP